TNAAHTNHKGTVKNAVDMAKAAAEAAGAATGNKAIGDVVKGAGATAKGGEAKSVNGIAKGIKGIVDAAGKADAKEGKLNAAGAAGGNEDAGKLFVKNAGNEGGGADDAGKAAAAVAAVSGEQILKAIVDAAEGGDKTGKKAADATNPIEAAIGSTGADAAAAAFTTMKKDDQIAAAMVLRGIAKDGQFALKDDAHTNHKGTVKNAVDMTKAAAEAAGAATGSKAIGDVVKGGAGAAKGGDAASVNGIAKGIKGIVDAAGKADAKEGKLDVAGAKGETNKDAGKLFVKRAADDGGEANDAGKAAAAVAASAATGSKAIGDVVKGAVATAAKGGEAASVNGIAKGIKGIVDAAEGGDKQGKKAEEATNPIDAAIGGSADAAAAAFATMTKNDQIAAAMVLRGMAKDGQFALTGGAAAHEGTVKNAVDMVKAAAEAAVAATGNAAIGDVINGAAKAKGGEAASVNGIAKG
ncbi:variable large family protein, partial [Borreliella garinii]|uniref:variable large family protein n=2 Tax=Borreliella garinii TaxID=29519 RepID=UPI001AEE8198